MSHYIYILVLVLSSIICACAQKGIFYEPENENEDRRVLHYTLASPWSNGKDRFSNVKLNSPMYFYGQAQNNIQIYLEGVVGFGELLPSCPIRNLTSEKFSAVYWLPNNAGLVTFREATSRQLNIDRPALTIDVNKAFNKAKIQASDITSVVYVTWHNMTNTFNYKPQVNFNSFQVVYVTTTKGNISVTYQIQVYRILSYSANHRLDGLPQECKSVALIAINSGSAVHRFLLSAFFPFRTDWAGILTNQADYQLIGRYAFKLEGFGGAQPRPPQLNCRGDNPDKFCQAVNWFAVVAKIHKEFCLFREQGVYPYPLSCERLIKCGNNGVRDVLTCPLGLHFNPILSICDHKENVECNLPADVKIVTETSSKIGFTFKPRQVTLHNNKCKFLGNGIYTDPSSCKFFLLCNNARSNRMKCPTNLLFDSKRLICDYPERVFCNVTSTTITPTTTKTIVTTTKQLTTKMMTTIKSTHLRTTKYVAYTSKKWFPNTTLKPHTTRKWFPKTSRKPHSTRKWLEYTTQKPGTTRKWVPNTTRKPRRTRKAYKTNKWYIYSTRKPRTRKHWFNLSTQRPYTTKTWFKYPTLKPHKTETDIVEHHGQGNVHDSFWFKHPTLKPHETETDIVEHHGQGNVPDSFWYGPSGHV